MAKPAITKRVTKGSALTYAELDTNFQNLRDATINFTDGVNTLSMDLNDTVTVQGQSTHNMSVTVNEAGNVITVDNLLSDYTFEPTGFENRTDSVISFNLATRSLVIQPAVTSYRVWTQGEMRIKTTTETRQIPDVSDLYYFYFDSSGVLQYTTSPNFQTHCLVAAVQWNALDGDYYFLGEERHGIVMDWATHEYLNKTQGFKYASGLLATNYTTSGTGSSNADAQIDLNSGELYQEDIKVTVTHSNSPTYSNFEQDLQGPGRFPVMYHIDSTGQWRKDSATDYPVKQGTARITYNLNTAGNWTTPDASNNHYVAMWLVATANIKDGPIIALMGQREDVNIDNARTNNTWSSLDLTNFPGNETRPLYRLIFKTGTGYANTPKCFLADIEDYRTTDVRGAIATGGGGASGITAVVDDTTPQLGGDLDVNGFSIISASNGNISIEPNGTGTIFLTPNTGNVVSESTITYFGKSDSNATIALNTASTSPAKILDIRAVSGSTNVAVQLNSSGTLGLIASANIDCNETVLRSALFRSVGLEYYNAGTVSGTFAPNTVNGTLQEITLNGSITINGFNAAASTQPDYKKMLFLIIKQPSSGGPYTLSSTMKFRNGDKTLSTAANAIDMIEIYHTGADYYAILHKAFA